jgi:OOP family OmpA-OmpF porin
MQGYKTKLAIGLALASVVWPVVASAQAAGADLMAMDIGSLRGEIQTRYDAALTLTQDGEVVAANNPRFVWASQAKAQCGIALGFLKSGTKDPVSVGKCDDAYQRMLVPVAAAPVVMAAPAVAQPDESCQQPIAGIVFFDFDSFMPPESAMQTIESVVSNMQKCGWSGLTVTGHTDRAGSDQYNAALSLRRANAIVNLLESRGIARSALNVSGQGEAEPRVPTIDGERNPQNRRVEITVK